MALNPEDWSIDANEALELSLFTPSTGKECASNIHPIYTYPLFGENETIFGYKDLKVRIMFAADDMTPCVEITFAEKVKKVGDVEAEDVQKALEDYLPEKAFTTDPPSFIKSLKSRTTPFSPPGVLTTSYVHTTPSRQIQTIEIWRTSLADPACRALVDNMQILVSLYIEGGTPLDLEDEDWVNKRWEVFFLYAKDSSSSSGNGPAYNFIGYCTLYRHFYFHKTNNNLSRTRLSQFLVLPPYQKQGHGAKFYSAIVDHYMAIPEVVELTVEDPSEPFADLRDLCDLARIRRDPDFKALQLTDIAKLGLAEVTEPLRKKHKMPKRQFYRTLELELLSRLDKRKKREYKQYRLFVKKRIYMQNADVLSQLDRLEKIDKLEETYIHVEDDYYRLLKAAKTRKLELVEEEDGDENGDDRDDGLEKRAAKRQRI